MAAGVEEDSYVACGDDSSQWLGGIAFFLDEHPNSCYAQSRHNVTRVMYPTKK